MAIVIVGHDKEQPEEEKREDGKWYFIAVAILAGISFICLKHILDRMEER